MTIYYTDGSCEPNPGTGGFAVIKILPKHNSHASDKPFLAGTAPGSVDVPLGSSPSSETVLAQKSSGHKRTNHTWEGSDNKPVVLGGEFETTNIRMEGLAIIAALEDAAGEPAEIYTDSEFWIKVITIWSLPWEANGWKKKGGAIKNLDIVQAVCPLYKKSQAKLVWVRGHNNDPGNELADHWANEARKQQLLK